MKYFKITFLRPHNLRRQIGLTLGLVLIMGISVYAQMPIVPGAEASPFGSYINDQPPIIYSIQNIPAEPKAGEQIKILAEVANDPEMTDDETVEVTLYYSVDKGANWKKVEMKQDENEPKLWQGLIPGQAKGVEVQYYIAAKDTSGNLTTEMPGMNTVWPPDAKKNIFPFLGQVVTDKDDDIAVVPDDMDLLEFAVGYNEEEIYGRISVQGKISPGTLEPTTFIHAYGVGIFNPDRGEDLLKGAGIVHAPIFPQIPDITKEYGIDTATIMIDASIVDTKKPIPKEESGVEGVAIENSLYFKFKQKVVGDNPSRRMKFLAGSLASNTTDVAQLTSKIIPLDATPYICAYLRTHSFKVK